MGRTREAGKTPSFLSVIQKPPSDRGGAVSQSTVCVDPASTVYAGANVSAASRRICGSTSSREPGEAAGAGGTVDARSSSVGRESSPTVDPSLPSTVGSGSELTGGP